MIDQSLILGFNTFLPAGYKIEVRPAPAQVLRYPYSMFMTIYSSNLL